MPDEAIYAERALAFWQRGSLPLLHGQGAGYGVLYPMLAGFPLAIGNFADGYASLKLLQALVVSLSAVPVWLYARHVMPARYAFTAAALTVASPLLLYSGLVMTEVLFYPLAALTLLAIVRAVATATARHQALALALIGASVLTRVQAVAFVAVFAAAIAVDTTLARDRSRLRAFWPTWLVLAVAAAAAAAQPGLFGSYAGTLRGSYPLGPAVGLTFDHLSYLALSTGIIPAAALVLLMVETVRGRVRDAESRALISVTACAVVVITVQVGFFAARYSPHLLGRDLAALPPLLFLTFALWLSRGMPRGLVAGALATFGVLAALLLTPWNHLVSATALPDSFGVAILYRLHGNSPADAVMVASIVALALCALVPRRAWLVLAVVVLAALTASSVIASNQIRQAVAADQQNLVGSPPNWIDRAATGSVTALYDGETYWNGVWQELFWNRRLHHIVSVNPSFVPGPVGQKTVTIPPDGLLPTADRYVVASNLHTFFGTPVAHVTQTGLDVSGQTLWRLDSPPRLSTVEHGVLPNGDMVTPATVDVYDCRRGTLELTLLPKATKALRILFDGLPVLRTEIGGLVWHGSIPVPPSSSPRDCRFTILGQSLLGSTRIEFVRAD